MPEGTASTEPPELEPSGEAKGRRFGMQELEVCFVLLIALAQIGLPIIGVQQSFVLGAAVWCVFVGILIHIIWRWERSARFGKLGRGTLSVLITAVMVFILWHPMTEQWRKEFSEPLLALRSAPNSGPSARPPNIRRSLPPPHQSGKGDDVVYQRFVFDESPWPNGMKKDISTDLSKYCAYLSGIGFEVPRAFPLIKLTGSMAFQEDSGKPRAVCFHIGHTYPIIEPDVVDVVINNQFLNDAGLVREAVSTYLLMGYTRSFDIILNDWKQRQVASDLLALYFSWSYAGKKGVLHQREVVVPQNWLDALWEIRATFGRRYTDRALYYGVKSIERTAWLQADNVPPLDRYIFYSIVVAGEEKVEGMEHVAETADICHKNGINQWTYEKQATHE